MHPCDCREMYHQPVYVRVWAHDGSHGLQRAGGAGHVVVTRFVTMTRYLTKQYRRASEEGHQVKCLLPNLAAPQFDSRIYMEERIDSSSLSSDLIGVPV